MLWKLQKLWEDKRSHLQFCKIIVVVLAIISLFVSIRSLWFTLNASIISGVSYYILWETYPRMMWLFSLAVNHKIIKVKKYFISKINFKKNPKLQTKDNFNFIEYYDEQEEQKFIYLFDKKHRSNDLIIFKNEMNIDITDTIEPYLGPLQNFHGTLLKPSDFNCKKLTVFRDGTISMFKTFKENEYITLS